MARFYRLSEPKTSNIVSFQVLFERPMIHCIEKKIIKKVFIGIFVWA